MFGWFKKREPEPAAASEPRDWVNIKAGGQSLSASARQTAATISNKVRDVEP